MSSSNINRLTKFPSWWKNPIWLFCNDFFRNKILIAGLLVFLGYWGIPFILSYLNDTLYSHQMIKDSVNISIPYLKDRTHLFFGISISIAAIFALYTLYKIPETIESLNYEEVLTESPENTYNLYLKNKKIANSLFPKIVSLFAATLAGIIFFRFYYLKDYILWWGNINYSYLNVYFVLVIILMIYYGTQIVFLFILSSRFLYMILKSGIKPKIFHHDNSNGMSALGNMIVLLWFVSVLIIICVYIVLFYGYMGLENSFLTKLLVAILSLTIPIIAILPLLKSLIEISKVKKQKLKIFGSILNENLNQIEKHALEKNMENVKSNVNSFLEVQQIFNSINKMNVFPFNPKALASVIIIYAFQIGVTIYKLVTV